MNLHKQRLAQGWSQEDVAMHAGLSVRTIQRIERGKPASLESLKCLAAVFETSVSELVQEQNMNPTTPVNTETQIEREERAAIQHVNKLKAFHMNWIAFVFIMPAIFLVNWQTDRYDLWAVWPLIAWLFFIGIHAMVMVGKFGMLGSKWEYRKFQEQMKDRR